VIGVECTFCVNSWSAGRGLEASAAPCELSPAAAAVLAPTRGALDERRRVGTDASALNTLAGARGGTVGTTLHKHKQKIRTLGRQKPNPAEEQAPYLEEEKARLLFLEASVDGAGAAGAPVAAPPDISAVRSSAARAGTSAARTAPVVDCLAAGAAAPAPGDAALAAGVGSGDGGEGSHLSEGPCPRLLPPHPPPRTSTPRSPGRRAPAARAASTPRSAAPGARG
jgi:hypothetical protein